MVVYFKKGIFMNGGSISWKRLFIVQSALVLGACGGGGSSDQASSCVSGIAGLCAILNPGGSNTQAGAAAISTLFTTAPSKITLASGGSANYTIGGGTAPYTATSGNTAVATATASGTNLAISSTSAGPAQVAVVDAAGKTVTIDVTVLAKGQTGTALSIFPAAINAGDCTTNIPFVFTGGTAPFTVLTSDNFGVPVSTALPLGPDSFFTASIRTPRSPIGVPFPYIATVTVLDSQSRTAVSKITIDFPTPPCPSNALLQTQPASANTRVTEIQTFQIIGGQPPYTVVSQDYDKLTTPPTPPTFATAFVNAGNASFNVTAKKVGTALITLKSADGQQANIVFTVLPAP